MTAILICYTQINEVLQSCIGFFHTLKIVDIPGDMCEKQESAHVYIPDLGSYGIIVYSLQTRKCWRIEHNFFHFDPLGGNFKVDGEYSQLNYGVYGMALGKQKNNTYIFSI